MRADSPLQSMGDLSGETLAYSRNGASTHSFALGFVNLLGVDAEPVATGGPPATLTAVMSGQVDVGWSAPPFGLQQIQEGQIRMIATSLDSPSVRHHTVRLIVTSIGALEQRSDVTERFMDGYRATIDWLYSGDEGLEAYAELANVFVDVALMIREDFDTREYVEPDVMLGVGNLMREAIEFDYLSEPLSEDQLNELILIDGWKMKARHMRGAEGSPPHPIQPPRPSATS